MRSRLGANSDSVSRRCLFVLPSHCVGNLVHLQLVFSILQVVFEVKCPRHFFYALHPMIQDSLPNCCLMTPSTSPTPPYRTGLRHARRHSPPTPANSDTTRQRMMLCKTSCLNTTPALSTDFLRRDARRASLLSRRLCS